MGIKFIGFRTRSVAGDPGGGVSNAVVVKASFLVEDLSEVAPLLEGFRALTARAAQKAAESPTAPKPSEAAAPKTEKKENVSSLDEARKKTSGKKAAAPAPPPAEEEAPKSDPSPSDDEGEDAEEPAAPETASAPVPAGPRPKAKITPAMVEAPRFTDVVVALHKQGFVAKEIVSICGKIHGQVEAVKRVKPEELEKRVERVFEIEGLA